MRAAVNDLALDLRDISVLTEAASGSFVVTCLMAALAGSPRVLAVTRDSPHGSSSDVMSYVNEWASRLGLAKTVEVTTRPASEVGAECSLVTNLGFVRPIDASVVNRLPKDGAISLMFEPWEFRPEDIDLAACRANDVPVGATCETHSRLQIFRYVGMVTLRLILEAEIEVFRSTIVVVGSDPFGSETEAVLVAAGARVVRLNPLAAWVPGHPATREALQNADAIVVTEYRTPKCMIGTGGLPIVWIAELGIPVVHLCGAIEYDRLVEAGVTVSPPGLDRPGFMKVTTAYVGPRPVIDLHAGGLKVGELLVRGRRAGGTASAAMRFALRNQIALALYPATENDEAVAAGYAVGVRQK